VENPADTPEEIIGEKIPLEEAMQLLWPGGRAIIACGHAFVGEEGHQTTVANILKLSADEKTLLGWAYNTDSRRIPRMIMNTKVSIELTVREKATPGFQILFSPGFPKLTSPSSWRKTNKEPERSSIGR